ncbi:unnamed protein product [Candida verbasci]|uniref:Ribosomal protein n=1 Tax=Candida verbasci TaxID=1227364 RepID=A0A9W4U0U9_9ASCO|nr:unnamed protein product [Candida verbasci]
MFKSILKHNKSFSTISIRRAASPTAPDASVKERKRKIKSDLKFKELDNLPKHPLYMPISQALNYLRSFEIGRPSKSTNIICTLFIKGEQGAIPISGTINIPFPPYRKIKPIIFTSNNEVKEVLSKTNLDIMIGGNELVDKFLSQELTPDLFTHAFATPELERHLKTNLGRILGPSGLQPTAKKGTVTDDPNKILQVLNSFQIRQKDSKIDFPIGNCDFNDYQIISNLKSISEYINKIIDDPNVVKKNKLGYCYISTGRTPPLVIDFK